MFKTEIRKLTSRHKDGSPMYVGTYEFVWCYAASVWHLIGMKPITEHS